MFMNTSTINPKTEELVALMKSNYRLQYVEEDNLRQLLSQSYVRSYSKGSYVFLEGDSVESFYVVVSGKVELNMNNHKFQEKIFSILNPGQLLGLPEVFNCHGIHTTNALCEEDCQLAVIPKDYFRSIIMSLPSLSLALLIIMGNMIGELRHELSLSSAEAKILAYLKNLMEQSSLKQEGDIVIPRNTSVEKLAKMLNITRETASRGLKNLKDRNIIDILKNYYVIKDKDAVMNVSPYYACLAQYRE